MASKSYGWDVRNIAKISPKMVKKGHFSTSEGKRPKPTPLPHMRLWFFNKLHTKSIVLPSKGNFAVFQVEKNPQNDTKFESS